MKLLFATSLSSMFLLSAGVFLAAESKPKGTFPGFVALSAEQIAAVADVPDAPGLPRVLLIGDSISIAYTQQVRAELKGAANVHHPDENCGPTVFGLDRLDAWLGTGKWAVIYFNFGLHDLKYLDAQENYVTPVKGHQVASPEQYGKNLRELVKRLQRTGAKLIFATTTPVPAGTNGRVEGSERAFNEVGRQVMQENGVAIDDLHAFALPRLAEIQLPQNVHFTPAGSGVIARRVAATIRVALAP
jgi:acyl-CoA thioesterase-1